MRFLNNLNNMFNSFLIIIHIHIRIEKKNKKNKK